MTNIQSAFLYDQLNDIENILENKKSIFSNYERLLDGLTKNGKVALFEQEEKTVYAPWIFAARLIGNSKTIEETTDFFRDNGIDIRPFFYPINKHGHLSIIENNDKISKLLNKEIIMIPSSPKITIEQQEKVAAIIYKFIFLNEKISVTEINDNNIVIINQFIPTINSKHFRYFDKRTSNAIKNHAITLLFYDEIKCVYFGYTHIDYDNASNKYWFGIYLDEHYRGKGFGGLLLNYTLNHNKIKDISEIHLSVDIDNVYAVKLYQKNNFTIYKSIDRINYMKIITRWHL